MIKIDILEIDKLLNNDCTQCNNATIFDSFIKADSVINKRGYINIMLAVSGGSDSDIVIDHLYRLGVLCKIDLINFDTGLEYQATKDHLKYLETKYNVKIKSIRAVKPIPLCCKEYGQPFLSKQVSEWISRLQRHNFKWEDKPFEELYKEYPKCKAALRWWCNKWEKGKDESESKFNIGYNKYLKQFMIANPPSFKISNKCCHYSKKLVAHNYKVANDIDLSITGIRKSEGGARASAYKNCFTIKDDTSEYRLIFWYTNNDKKEYERVFNVVHSRCYSEYGLTRTGCAGCPFGKDFEKELEIIQKYEPKLYMAVNNIFGDSYEYTRKYKKFVEDMKQ